MSYFSEWNREIERVTKEGKSDDFVRAYYQLEQKAYEQILSGYPDAHWNGSFAELQQTLGFKDQPLIFAGFLEGINESLETPLDLDSLTDESPIVLSIQFEKLLYNMYDAKAHWLYDLSDWDKVMPRDQRMAIAKKYRTDHIAVSNKVGRNDPCICGSGKKFKNCCGR